MTLRRDDTHELLLSVAMLRALVTMIWNQALTTLTVLEILPLSVWVRLVRHGRCCQEHHTSLNAGPLGNCNQAAWRWLLHWWNSHDAAAFQGVACLLSDMTCPEEEEGVISAR
eukprot:5268329-Amphidinium_carterae.2